MRSHVHSGATKVLLLWGSRTALPTWQVRNLMENGDLDWALTHLLSSQRTSVTCTYAFRVEFPGGLKSVMQTTQKSEKR